MKIDILAIGAHPDDVELGCGGTLLKMVSQGKKIGIIDLTQGELGTRGTAETRKQEAQNSAEILGVSIRENLKFQDGFLTNDEKHQLEIIKILRKYRPALVLANAVDDRHPDHGKAAKLVYDACFLSGLVKIETTLDGEIQQAWRPKHLFNYLQWNEAKPDFIIDISGFLDTKIEACMAYKTQFYDPNSKEPVTPITSANFKNSLRYRAQNLGRLIGIEAGEGFTSASWIGLKDFNNFI